MNSYQLREGPMGRRLHRMRNLWAMAAVIGGATIVATSAASDQGRSQGTRRCYASDGGCYPNPATYGYYPTQWRRWPGEPTEAAPKKAPTEAVPTPSPLDGAAPSRTQPPDRTKQPGTTLPDAGDRPPTPPGDFEIPEFPNTPKRKPSTSPFELDTPEFDVPSGPGRIPLNPLKPSLDDDPFKDDAQLEPPAPSTSDVDDGVRPSKRPLAPQAKRSLHWGGGPEAGRRAVQPASAADSGTSTDAPPAEALPAAHALAPRRAAAMRPGASFAIAAHGENPLRQSSTLNAAIAQEHDDQTATQPRNNPLRSR